MLLVKDGVEEIITECHFCKWFKPPYDSKTCPKLKSKITVDGCMNYDPIPVERDLYTINEILKYRKKRGYGGL